MIGRSQPFDPAVLGPTVDLLAALAGDRPALELAIGTGRVALPPSERGVRVSGIELSEAMLARLRQKPGADGIHVTLGDMTTTRVEGEFGLVYLVFNTINNLLTRADRGPAPRGAVGGLGAAAAHRRVHLPRLGLAPARLSPIPPGGMAAPDPGTARVEPQPTTKEER